VVRFEEGTKDTYKQVLTRGAYSNKAFQQHICVDDASSRCSSTSRTDSKINVGRSKNAGYYHALSLLGESEPDVEMDVDLDEVESVSTLSDTPLDEVTMALEGMFLDRYIDDETWVLIGKRRKRRA
jgi:hypothetical protein